jgi:hypothetical protein
MHSPIAARPASFLLWTPRPGVSSLISLEYPSSGQPGRPVSTILQHVPYTWIALPPQVPCLSQALSPEKLALFCLRHHSRLSLVNSFSNSS